MQKKTNTVSSFSFHTPPPQTEPIISRCCSGRNRHGSRVSLMITGISSVRFLLFTTVMPFLQPQCSPLLLLQLKVRRLVVFLQGIVVGLKEEVEKEQVSGLADNWTLWDARDKVVFVGKLLILALFGIGGRRLLNVASRVQCNSKNA
ncbi:hypothetical protein TSUD_240870 [Trifolium subterraneum]|uniref:Uncharacterized protein n=1 Tax=Trifolium subterraneum TaxID=3900 RepID=A0A2Z6PB27_TRISU|nr:hypothetical protein TSUD_240870 [Trifolium subterraneum]